MRDVFIPYLEVTIRLWKGQLTIPKRSKKVTKNCQKLVYNLFAGLTTYLYRGYNPFTKYDWNPSAKCTNFAGGKN